MAITAARVSVTSTATKIAENTASGGGADTATLSFVVKNVTATVTVYLAGANTVTTANGFQWDALDGPLAVDLEPGEALWGIVATTTQVMHVLGGGR